MLPYFYWQLLLLLLSSCYCLTLVAIGVVNAQETVESKEPVSESPIAQSAPSQPARPRLRVPFFEDERKLRFGFGDFLQSALDGVDNFYGADAINNLSNDPLSNPLAQNINGTLTVQSRDENDSNFLTTTFNAPGVSLIFTDPSYGSDPRIGSITVNGSITLSNGTTLSFNDVRSYNGSFSAKSDQVSGAIQLVDPSNPGTTILIQLPVTSIENIGDVDDSDPLSRPATLSIGLPTDR
jgi:hypothetical protein